MRVSGSLDFKIGFVLGLVVVGMGGLSLFYTPYDYNQMAPAERFIPPGWQHLMGTDNFGRDVFSRIMTGAQYTLLVSIGTVLGSLLIGASLGLISGYRGGLLDEMLMRLMDTLSSFPGILVALMMVSLMDNKPHTLMIALLILFIPSYVRIMRSGVLACKHRDFVKTAALMGASHCRIIFVHILPNLTHSLFSATVLGLSNAILAEATMSYLGLGIQPPIPSWGRMLSESQSFLFNAPWCALSPGLMIMLTVVAFHSIGEAIRQR
ncbi:MAG: ABC transporter permease [Spirochaetaceae bacterium]|jgi:peptide/nickel transport system permease protein|nr:ABC transporter permease [Spirochaetaceae bacterium]